MRQNVNTTLAEIALLTTMLFRHHSGRNVVDLRGAVAVVKLGLDQPFLIQSSGALFFDIYGLTCLRAPEAAGFLFLAFS